MWSWRKHSRPSPKPADQSTTIWIPARVLDRTVEVLRESGGPGHSHEGIAYWAGRRAGGDCFVTTCIAPAAQTTKGSFETTAHTNARVIMYLANVGFELLGQVHSHPGAWVEHSDGDDARALMPYSGFLSIIVPDYARREMNPLTICGIHCFEGSEFRRLSNAEVEKSFRIVDEIADLRK